MSDRIKLADGKEAVFKRLSRAELRRAASYAGKSPTGVAASVAVTICAIRKIKSEDGVWSDVFPLRSRAAFIALGKQLAASDLAPLATAVKTHALESMSATQRAEFEAFLGATSSRPLVDDRKGN